MYKRYISYLALSVNKNLSRGGKKVSCCTLSLFLMRQNDTAFIIDREVIFSHKHQNINDVLKKREFFADS